MHFRSVFVALFLSLTMIHCGPTDTPVEPVYTEKNMQLLLTTADQARVIWGTELKAGLDFIKARDHLLSEIKKLDGVSDSFITPDGLNVQIDFTFGGHHLLDFVDDISASPSLQSIVQSVAAQSQTTPLRLTSFKSKNDASPLVDSAQKISNLDVLIWSPFDRSITPNSLSSVEALFNASKCPKFGVVAERKNESASIESIKDFGKFGTVLILSHGGLLTAGKKGDSNREVLTGIFTGEAVTPEGGVIYANDLDAYRLGTHSQLNKTLNPNIPEMILKLLQSPYYAFTSRFIETYVKGMPKSTVLAGACFTSRSDMSKAFTAAGAGSYMGFDKIATTPFISESILAFFTNLLAGHDGKEVPVLSAWNTVVDKSDPYFEHTSPPLTEAANFQFVAGKDTDGNLLYQTDTQLVITPGQLDFDYRSGVLVEGTHAIHVENQGCDVDTTFTPKDPWVTTTAAPVTILSGTSQDVPVNTNFVSVPFGNQCRISSSVQVGVIDAPDFTAQNVKLNLSRDGFTVSQSEFNILQDPKTPFSTYVILQNGNCEVLTPYIESSVPWLNWALDQGTLTLGARASLSASVDWSKVPGAGLGLADQVGTIKIWDTKGSNQPPQTIAFNLVAQFQLSTDSLSLSGTRAGGGVFPVASFELRNTDGINYGRGFSYSLGVTEPWMQLSASQTTIGPLESITLGLVVNPEKIPVDARSGDVLEGDIAVTGTATGFYPITKVVHIRLTLTGVSSYKLSTTQVDFGSFIAGTNLTASTQNIQITNDGAIQIQFDISQTDHSWISTKVGGGSVSSITLQPGVTASFDVNAYPTRYLAPSQYVTKVSVTPYDVSLAPSFVQVQLSLLGQCFPTVPVYPSTIYAPVTVVKVNTEVTFAGRGLCSGGYPPSEAMHWDFGDGPLTVGVYAGISHVYTRPGLFNAGATPVNPGGYPALITVIVTD